ncbi:MAG TPA: ATP-binding protein [Egibacteraceae bacterium]|nr:ATP-binding protein [Egibacteraceae bacterium]
MSAAPDAAMLDWLPDPTVVVGPDGRIVACNRLANRLAGSELTGKPADEVLALTDEAGRDWWTCARPLEADPRLAPRIPETDLELQVDEERTRPVTLVAARVQADDGSVHLLVSLRRAERRRRLDAARSDLVSTVSHEIRSPLTSVKGFTKTLLAKWDRFTDDQKRQMLATVNDDADRVTRLLGELLDVSRIDAGRLRLRRQLIDIGTVVGRVVDRFAVADPRGRVAVALPDGMPQLYADPDKIDQVVTNLVENALKYSDGPVQVRGVVRTDEVEINVSDEGPGIAAEHLEEIFTKFFRRSGERRSGTGLGLYIAKGIVEAHGGRLWATSAVGQGSRFSFTLPRGGLGLVGLPVPGAARRVEETRT